MDIRFVGVSNKTKLEWQLEWKLEIPSSIDMSSIIGAGGVLFQVRKSGSKRDGRQHGRGNGWLG